MKRTIFLGIFIFIILLLVGWIVISVTVFAPYKGVSLKDLSWVNNQRMIAFQINKKKTGAQTLLVRLTDGKEQPFPGSWNVNFNDQGNGFVFGSYQDNKGKTQRKLFYIEQGEKIQDIDLTETDLEVLDVQANKQATYLLIKIRMKTGAAYCIFERINDSGRKSKCKLLSFPYITESIWNPKKEREVVIRMANDTIVIYDVWEKPRFVFKDEEEDFKQELLSLFNKKKTNPMISSDNVREYFRVLNMLFVKEKNKKWFSMHLLPLFSKISWLHDSDHIIFKDVSSYKILELSSRRIVTLLTFQKNDDLLLKFHEKGQDIMF